MRLKSKRAFLFAVMNKQGEKLGQFHGGQTLEVGARPGWHYMEHARTALDRVTRKMVPKLQRALASGIVTDRRLSSFFADAVAVGRPEDIAANAPPKVRHAPRRSNSSAQSRVGKKREATAYRKDIMRQFVRRG
jgi:hypothetical protein